MNNQRRIVVVTGASAGVGRATVREFARQGADVAVLARGTDGLEEAMREVGEYGGRSLILACDVSDYKSVERAADDVEEHLGPIDVWVNNAMNSVFSPVIEMKPEEYRRVTEVTYLGQVYGALAALKRMIPRDKGSIVFVGSALAYRGIPLQSAYCASKHAVEGFYDSLRSELMHDKRHIKTCMVQLPAMNTTQFGFVKNKLPKKPRPMGTIYQPEIAAKAIVYASEHNRREIFVGFPTLKAIYGNRIAPWFADRVLARRGFRGQMTNEPEDPGRKDNLWDPIPGDHGAHGTFGGEAVNFSLQEWMTTHPLFVTFVTIALAGAGILLSTRNSSAR